MGALSQRLDRHLLVGLDTCVFIYHLERHPSYLTITQRLFSSIERGQLHAVTSVITIMELITRPLSLGQTDAARDYEAVVAHFPHLAIADVDRDVAREAALLRARYGTRAADALQVAAALHTGASGFVTNDRALLRLATALDIIVLDDVS